MYVYIAISSLVTNTNVVLLGIMGRTDRSMLREESYSFAKKSDEYNTSFSESDLKKLGYSS
jgi:hypothetical protein